MSDESSRASPRASSREVEASQEYLFRYDMENAPLGELLNLLTIGAVCQRGKLRGDIRDKDIVGWARLPGRDKVEELRRGLFSNNYHHERDNHTNGD